MPVCVQWIECACVCIVDRVCLCAQCMLGDGCSQSHDLSLLHWHWGYVQHISVCFQFSHCVLIFTDLGFGPSVAAPTLDEQEQRREVEQMLRADCLEEEIGNLFSGYVLCCLPCVPACLLGSVRLCKKKLCSNSIRRKLRILFSFPSFPTLSLPFALYSPPSPLCPSLFPLFPPPSLPSPPIFLLSVVLSLHPLPPLPSPGQVPSVTSMMSLVTHTMLRTTASHTTFSCGDCTGYTQKM